MIVKAIELENIRSYLHERIEFPLGSILLKGDIGAGKSTILYAIEFALFGIVNDLTYEMLLRKGASFGRIKLFLEHNGKNVIITRTIKRGKNFSQEINIAIDGREKKLTDRELRSIVFKMLNYPLELINAKQLYLFRYTIYTPQEQMKQILQISSAERLKTIQKIFGIDKYELVRDNVKKYARELRHKIQLYETELISYDELKQKHAQLNLNLQKWRLDYNEKKLIYKKLNDELQRLKQEFESLQEELKEHEKKLKEISLLNENLIKNENEIRNVEEKIMNLFNQIDRSRNKLKDTVIHLRREIDASSLHVFQNEKFYSNTLNLYQQLEALINQFLDFFTKFESDFNNFKSNLEAFFDLLNGFFSKSKFDEHIKLFENCLSDFDELIFQINEVLKAKEDFISRTEKKIYDVNKKFDVLLAKIESFENKKSEIEQYKDEIKKLNDEIHALSYDINALEKVESEIVELEKLISEKQKLIGANENKKIEKLKVVKNIQSLDVCPLCLQKVDETHKEKIKNQFNDEIVEINKTLTLLHDELDALNEKLQELKKQKDALQRMKEKQRHLNDLIKRYENLISERENEINVMHEYKKELEKLKKLKSALETTDLEHEKEVKDQVKTFLDFVNKIKLKLYQMMNDLKLFFNSIENIKMFHDQKKILQRTQNELKEKLNALKSNLDDGDRLKQEYEKMKRELTNKEEQLLRITKELSSLEANIKNAQSEITQLNEKISKMNEIKIKHNNAKKLKDFLKTDFVALTQNIEEHIRLNIFKEFDEYYKLWFDKLIDNELMLTRLDLDFTPIIEQNGYEIDYMHLSGGERTACALAYRLALNKVVSDFFNLNQSIIILDEPTDGFSYEQLDKMKEIINDLSFSQIIIVSHETKIESFVDHVIKIEKVNGVSKVSYE